MANGPDRDDEREVGMKRYTRHKRREYFAELWDNQYDEHDIFDLRFLFDDEEIREERERIELYAENPAYFRFLIFEDDRDQDLREDEEREDLGDEYDSGIEMDDDESDEFWG